MVFCILVFFFFSSRRRHTRSYGDWSSDVCSSDLTRGSLLCPFSGREGVKRLRWLLRFSGSRSLRHLPKLGGEQGGIEVASALQGAGIDDQVGQAVEVTHRVE